MAIEHFGVLSAVLRPDEGASFWRPLPTNGYFTVKTSPSYGGPGGITMGIQVMPYARPEDDLDHDATWARDFRRIGRPRKPGEATPAPFDPPRSVTCIFPNPPDVAQPYDFHSAG